MREAFTWTTAFHMARQEYNEKIKLPKHSAGGVPPRFSESPLSLNLGANNVYRDQNPRNSLQIREYDDHYTVEMDRHNPDEGNAIKHAVTDAAKYTFVAVAAGMAIFGGKGG